jgi:inhibitor of the pro-sigma K processing machinery
MVENIKWTVKNIVIGIVLIYVINMIGVKFNMNIPVNIITIFIAGFLRVPGVVILLILSKI